MAVTIVKKLLNEAGLLTVVLSDGQRSVQCTDMMLFDDDDLECTFAAWCDMASDASDEDCGCTFV